MIIFLRKYYFDRYFERKKSNIIKRIFYFLRYILKGRKRRNK